MCACSAKTKLPQLAGAPTLWLKKKERQSPGESPLAARSVTASRIDSGEEPQPRLTSAGRSSSGEEDSSLLQPLYLYQVCLKLR